MALNIQIYLTLYMSNQSKQEAHLSFSIYCRGAPSPQPHYGDLGQDSGDRKGDLQDAEEQSYGVPSGLPEGQACEVNVISFCLLN